MPILRSIRNGRLWRPVLPLLVLAVGLPDQTAGAEISAKSPLYSALGPAFTAVDLNLTRLEVVERRPAGERYAVLLVRAATPADARRREELGPDGRLMAGTFGLFLVDARSDALHLTLGVFATEGGYEVASVRADERSATVGQHGAGFANYWDVVEKETYFYDPEARRFLGKVKHRDVRIDSLVESDGALYALGTEEALDPNRASTILVRVKAPGQPGAASSYEVIDRFDGQPIQVIQGAEEGGGKPLVMAGGRRYVLEGGRWRSGPMPDPRSFKARQRRNLLSPGDGSGAAQFLVRNSELQGNWVEAEERSGVYEIDATGRRFHRFPEPTFDLFAKLRPKEIADGYTEADTQLSTAIGPFQLEGRRLWFGTRFYEGEGYNGVGGFGYFDVDTRKYHMTYDRLTADLSVSSLFVDDRFVWLGLFSDLEGGKRAGGLLRYAKADGTMKRYEVPAVIHAIRRAGDHLYLGASDGLYVLGGESLTHVELVPDLSGRYFARIAKP